MDKNKRILIIPLGGLGQIGKNITLFEYNDDIIIVDCGIQFPTEEMPGIDFLIPDFTYLLENKDRVKGMIVTHGHEDHIGAIPYLLKNVNVPIYATKLTIGLIKSRLEEKSSVKNHTFIEVFPRDVVHIGEFLIEFIKVNHSIIGGVGLAIQTKIGTIIHTGDFKIDFSPIDNMVLDITQFAHYGEKGVLLLMSDSTNSESIGYTKSESILSEKLTKLFSHSKGRIIVATFASNIHRIQQVLNTATRYNRKVVISGLSMQKNIEIAKRLGFLSFKEDLIVDIDDANSIPHKKLVIICTGSQGEPMSALNRMANGIHKHFYAVNGDTVIITASIIPGNERTVNNVVNSLMKLGATVYHEREEDIHVSGHASSEELKLMITLTRPKFFMPIHGEFKQLVAHGKIAESLNIKPTRIMIADEGAILELTKKKIIKIEQLDLKQPYVDGSHIGDSTDNLIEERQKMSSNGIVIVIITMAEGMLIRTPDIIIKGQTIKRAKLFEKLKTDLETQIKKQLRANNKSDDIKIAIKNKTTSNIYKITKANPLVEVIVLEV